MLHPTTPNNTLITSRTALTTQTRFWLRMPTIPARPLRPKTSQHAPKLGAGATATTSKLSKWHTAALCCPSHRTATKSFHGRDLTTSRVRRWPKA